MSQFGSGDANAQRDYEQGRAFSALRDHWWVQVNQGGNWVDYDLMSPDGQPGNALATASATMLPDAVPEDQLHRVLLRVVAEQLKNGTLTETAILEHAFDPKELFGKRISLRHVPMMWPADWAAITSEDVQEKLFAALMTQKEWMPALTVGGEAYQQGSVRDSGDLNPDPKPKSNPFLALAFPAAGKVGRVADVFDDLLEQAAPEGGGNAPPGDAVRAEGELTAEWLEFTILVPGEQPKIVRRELFDILGPATRSSGDFSNFRMDDDKRLARSAGEMIETEILIQPSWPASEFVADLTAQLALANKPVLDEFARDPFGKAPPNSMELFSKMTGIAGPAYLYSMLRSEVVMTSPSVFVDRPQVVAQHSMLTRAAPGELTSRTALDVVENGIGVDPFGPDAFSVRLLQGIADTNAEALALGEEGRRNVGEAFAQTLDNEDWTVLFPGDEKKVEGLSLAPDLAARILADLAAGYAVVSPPGTAPDAQRAGWWRIDPSTGATLGMGEQGWGAVLVEYAFYLTVQAMLAEIACMATAASEEERLRGLGAEEARQKVKIWARQCVSQALLQSITGMSTAWIENRFIHGASTRSLSRSSGARPSAPSIPRGSARPQSTAGHAPHPSAPRTPSAPRSPGPAPSSAAPHAPGTSPSSGTPSAPRSPAASTSSSSSSSSSQPHPQSSAPKPAPDMRKAPEAQKSAPKPPGDADHAVKSHTDRHMEARRLEQEAAQKYRQNPTPENLKHYETAEAKARDARWSELNEYAKNGGRGLPPGLRPKGQQSAPAGPGPVSGTAPTQPGLPPTQRPASGTAPTQPGVPPTERPASGTAQTQPGVPPTERPASGTAPTLPGVPPTQRSPSGGDHAAPTQHSPSPHGRECAAAARSCFSSRERHRADAAWSAADAAVSFRRRSCRADATFSESHGRECAAAARRPRTRERHGADAAWRSTDATVAVRRGHAPPTQHSPSPMAESVPPPRGAPGPVSGTAPTQPGRRRRNAAKRHRADTTRSAPDAASCSGTAPTQPGVPPTQRPASGTARHCPGPNAASRQRHAHQPAHPPTERAQSPQPRPMTPADQRVQPHTERHLDARRQEIEAAKRLQQNPTEANRKAYEAAEAATKDAAFAEQAEFRRQGGEGLPPGLRPGAREPLPGTPAPSPMAESVSRPQPPAPAPGPATQSSAAPTQASPSPTGEVVPAPPS